MGWVTFREQEGDSSRALGQDRTWWNGEHGPLVHFSLSAHVQVCHHLWVQGGTGFPTPALTEKDSLSLSATEGTASEPPWAWPAVSYAKLQPLPINKAKKKKKKLFLIHGKLPKWPFLLPEPAHLRGCSVWLCISKQQLHPQDSFIPHIVPSCPSPSTQGDKTLARA